MHAEGWRKGKRRKRSRTGEATIVRPGCQMRRKSGSRGGSQTHLRPAYEAGAVSDLPAVRKLACVRPPVGRPWRRCRWCNERLHLDFDADWDSRPGRRRSFGTKAFPASRAMLWHPTILRRAHGRPAIGNRHSGGGVSWGQASGVNFAPIRSAMPRSPAERQR